MSSLWLIHKTARRSNHLAFEGLKQWIRLSLAVISVPVKHLLTKKIAHTFFQNVCFLFCIRSNIISVQIFLHRRSAFSFNCVNAQSKLKKLLICEWSDSTRIHHKAEFILTVRVVVSCKKSAQSGHVSTYLISSAYLSEHVEIDDGQTQILQKLEIVTR